MVHKRKFLMNAGWNLVLLAGFLPAVALWFVPSVRSQPVFADVAAQVGITNAHDRSYVACPPVVGSGSAWADYDNDGDIDLYVTNQGGPCYLYRNEGDTDGDNLPNFIETAAAAGVANEAGIGHSCVFIDFDNDGDEDLFVTNWGSNILFANQLIETGSPVFADVTTAAGLVDYGKAVTSAWGDYNGDGYLDVYLAKHTYCTPDDQSEDQLYRNNGDGTFTNVTGLLCPGGIAPCPMTSSLGFTAGWVDYDNDADIDLYLANDAMTALHWPNVLWRNDGPDGSGGWIFTDVSVASGTGRRENSMGLGIGDYDNNGFMDFAFSNIGTNVLLRNRGDGTFEDVSEVAGIEREFTPSGDLSVTWGTVFFDYNNDQWLDLFFVAGMIGGRGVQQPDILFENNGDGTFTDVSAASGIDDTLRGRSASIVDLDHDGYVDLFVGNLFHAESGDTAPFRLFHNRSRELGNTHHWLTVTVNGTTSNRDGIGTRLYATTPDGITQIRDITSGPTYGGGDYRAAFFGLGDNVSAGLSVRWPDGAMEDLGTVSVDQEVHLVQGIPLVPSQVILVLPEDQTSLPPVPTAFFWHEGRSHIDTYWFEYATDSLFTTSTVDSVLTDTTTVVEDIESNQTYWWRVRAHNAAGWGPFSDVWSFSTFVTAVDESDIPREFLLSQNYPNPFNPSTTIGYALPVSAYVKLEVFNVLGERVRVLKEGPEDAGYYSVVFEAERLPGGIYFYRLQARPLANALSGGEGRDRSSSLSRAGSSGSRYRFMETRKLVLMK